MTRLCLLCLLIATAGCGTMNMEFVDDAGPSMDAAPNARTDPWTRFADTPYVDGDADGLVNGFDGVASGAAPCLIEPQTGTLYPQNWLRPRIRWTALPGAEGYEIRMRAPDVGELRAYTRAQSWILPEREWQGLSKLTDTPISVEVRALVGGVPTEAALADVQVAPARADGVIVYWTTSGPALKGFNVGDETVREVFRPEQAGARCIGCHSSTPDGLYAGFSSTARSDHDADPSQFGLRAIDGSGREPPFLTDAARTMLAAESQKGPVFSAGHWRDGDRIGLAARLVNERWELGWIDLEASSDRRGEGWDTLERRGDLGHAVAPAFNHEGDAIVYTSEPSMHGGNGIVASTGADLYRVDWNGGAGGEARPLDGADAPGFAEYYPHFSPDDNLLAFARVAEPAQSFNATGAEVFTVSASGGEAHRLAANDPPSCMGAPSPGVSNSWPKWAPTAVVDGPRTFYWMAFSSTRLGGRPQIFVAPVVLEDGVVRSFPAMHLWNQPEDEGNHTPAWDVFQLI
ncbi:MAG: hypothetical protein AAF411_14340 [Myxococcota bacterium]